MRSKVFGFFPLLSLMVLGFLLNGCGYRLGNVVGENMRDVRTIYLPVVRNKTLEPNIHMIMTNELARRINNDGTFALGPEKGSDAIMEVSIVGVERQSLRRSITDVSDVEEMRITLTCEVTVTNLRRGERVLNKRLVSGSTDFFIQQNQQEAERQAIPLAAEDAAKKIIALIAEGW